MFSRVNFDQYLVDDKRKLIYAWIPKVLSSSLVYMMIYSTANFKHHYPNLNLSENSLVEFYTKVSGNFFLHKVNFIKISFSFLVFLHPCSHKNLTNTDPLIKLTRNSLTRYDHTQMQDQLRDCSCIYIQESRHGKHKVHGVDMTKFGLKKLSSYSGSQIMKRLRSYFVFIVVRDPYERLASAYKNMASRLGIKEKSFWKDTSKTLMKHYVNRVTDGLKKNPRAVVNNSSVAEITFFEEFLLYVIATKGRSNYHWSTYSDLVHPCHVRYDYIAKLETVTEDMPVILAQLFKFMPKTPQMLQSNANHQGISAPYGQVRPATMKQLAELFKYDFEMFGYDYNRLLQ